jgi:hypothetical protein
MSMTRNAGVCPYRLLRGGSGLNQPPPDAGSGAGLNGGDQDNPAQLCIK